MKDLRCSSGDCSTARKLPAHASYTPPPAYPDVPVPAPAYAPEPADQQVAGTNPFGSVTSPIAGLNPWLSAGAK